MNGTGDGKFGVRDYSDGGQGPVDDEAAPLRR